MTCFRRAVLYCFKLTFFLKLLKRLLFFSVLEKLVSELGLKRFEAVALLRVLLHKLHDAGKRIVMIVDYVRNDVRVGEVERREINLGGNQHVKLRHCRYSVGSGWKSKAVGAARCACALSVIPLLVFYPLASTRPTVTHSHLLTQSPPRTSASAAARRGRSWSSCPRAVGAPRGSRTRTCPSSWPQTLPSGRGRSA